MMVWLTVLVLAWVVVGAVLHRFYLLLRPPPASLFPSEGAVLSSASEGFVQQVLKADAERVWLRTTMEPHAAGPPPHVHARFAERLPVIAGCVTVDLAEGSKRVCAGEEYLIVAGTRHRLRNGEDDVAIAEPPLTADYGLPRKFGLFLVQAYGFFDESPANARPPRALLQMSFWSPWFDVWLAGPPVLVQRLLFGALRPLALLLGYRPWYHRFSPDRSRARVGGTTRAVEREEEPDDR